MKKTNYLWLFVLLIGVACGTSANPIEPARPIEQAPTPLSSPASAMKATATPLPIIKPPISLIAPLTLLLSRSKVQGRTDPRP